MWRILLTFMVRKEDSRLHGKVLSRFIKFSRCVPPYPRNYPNKANADGYRRLEADANVSHRPGGRAKHLRNFAQNREDQFFCGDANRTPPKTGVQASV